MKLVDKSLYPNLAIKLGLNAHIGRKNIEHKSLVLIPDSNKYFIIPFYFYIIRIVTLRNKIPR